MTDYERDAQTIREALESAFGDWEAGLAALERLVAALSAATTQRDEWMTPFDGSGIEWHESLPSPYTYQASDFSKLMAAVHEYECARDAGERRAEALAAQLQQAREAIDGLLNAISEWFAGDVPPQLRSDHRVQVAVLAAAAPATTEEPDGLR